MSAKLKFTKEEVLAAYSGKATIKDAMRALGCSYMPLVKLMREYGIAKKEIPELKDRAWLHEQIVERGRPQRDIAAELGTSPGNVASWCRKHDLYPQRSQSDAAKAWLAKRYPDGRRGPDAANWRGGRWPTGSGYMRIWKPDHPHALGNGYVYEHRLVMEEKLGRFLEPGEVVDHIDCNRSNNAPENLRLHATRSDHVKDHFRSRLEMNELRQRITELEAENKQLREPSEGGPTRAESLSED